jgi:hypothetical protein
VKSLERRFGKKLTALGYSFSPLQRWQGTLKAAVDVSTAREHPELSIRDLVVLLRERKIKRNRELNPRESAGSRTARETI